MPRRSVRARGKLHDTEGERGRERERDARLRGVSISQRRSCARREHALEHKCKCVGCAYIYMEAGVKASE